MSSKAEIPQDYVDALPEDRKAVITKIRQLIIENLPEGFKEVMGYGMLSYVVPHSTYPAGYHCNPKDPLPFISLASQKNFIALYYMGWGVHEGLLTWFTSEYAKQCKTKLDMGKSCIRFKKLEDIPYNLIAELVSKVTVPQWVEYYEKEIKGQ
jgi:uncharacterized protein YdhG (YjbR/CyaY superfamily)